MDRDEIERQLAEFANRTAVGIGHEAAVARRFGIEVARIYGVPEDKVEVSYSDGNFTARVLPWQVIDIEITAVPR